MLASLIHRPTRFRAPHIAAEYNIVVAPQYRTMTAEAGIYARHMNALDCYVQIGLAQGRVLSVEFPTTPPAEATSDHELLDRVGAYLAGEEDGFDDVPVALTLPTPDRDILETVRSVPYGESITVERLGSMVPGFDEEGPNSQRTIREALGENPSPIFIPTHRVRDAPTGAPADVVDVLRAVEDI